MVIQLQYGSIAIFGKIEIVMFNSNGYLCSMASSNIWLLIKKINLS